MAEKLIRRVSVDLGEEGPAMSRASGQKGSGMQIAARFEDSRRFFGRILDPVCNEFSAGHDLQLENALTINTAACFAYIVFDRKAV